MALPDQATFILENTLIGEGVKLEANHHCNEGTTGVLCFPQYILHNVQWKNTDRSKKWVEFQVPDEDEIANQNHGGLFSLSPSDAQVVMDGGLLEDSFFPNGFVSLVNQKYNYLLNLPGQPCVTSDSISAEYGILYDHGILCKVPLRALKIYSRGQVSGNAQDLNVEIWFDKGGLDNQLGVPDRSQTIGFHQIGRDNETPKQGYSLPVIPGANHSYRLSLTTDIDGTKTDIPSDWIVEFSDLVIGNRYSVEYINLSLNGKPCGIDGIVSSHHERKFIWSGDEFMADGAWGNTGACAEGVKDSSLTDCSLLYNYGILPATECPEMCNVIDGFNNNNSYCDCGSATYKCKPGFSGENCEVDMCSAARCGEHGTCSAKYLGGSLPATSNACVCDDGWTGSTCEFNPCQEMSCSGHGTCVAIGDTRARCMCDGGYFGENCQNSCDGVCKEGGYPYGCSTGLSNVVSFGCGIVSAGRGGSCDYFYDYEGEDKAIDTSKYCIFKTILPEEPASTPPSHPSSKPTSLPTLSPTSVPTSVPIKSPTFAPTLAPTSLPSSDPTESPTRFPSASPTPLPSVSPTSQTESPLAKPKSCNDVCKEGGYPYGCNTGLPNAVSFGCGIVSTGRGGRCDYFYDYEGEDKAIDTSKYCIFKTILPEGQA